MYRAMLETVENGNTIAVTVSNKDHTVVGVLSIPTDLAMHVLDMLHCASPLFKYLAAPENDPIIEIGKQYGFHIEEVNTTNGNLK